MGHWVVPEAYNLDKKERLELLYSWVTQCCYIFCKIGIEINFPDPETFIVSAPLSRLPEETV